MASIIPNSAIKASSQHPLLQQQLNVFALPTSILDGLTVRSLQVPSSSTTSASDPTLPLTKASTDQQQPDEEGDNTGLMCSVCPGSKFEDVAEQRAHAKGDWHRYNVRARMAIAGVGGGDIDKKSKGKVLSKDEFEGMVEGLSSISGSESTTSTRSTSDKVSTLLRKQKLTGGSTANHLDDDEASSQSSGDAQFLSNRAALRTALIWFTPPASLLPNTQLGFYRALFPSGLTNPSDFLPRLKELQLTADDLDGDEEKERRWVLLMVAGGHFAGMVVALGGKRTGKKVVKGAAGEVRVLKHKTFHRYTTRRKQGGSQSSHDKANGAANSIGAQIRRAGEVMLQEEIRALLESWRDDFNVAERVFVRGSVSGKKIFWGHDEAVIQKTDERIRTFPFPTRRPTLAELLRCFQELIRVKTSFLTEDALAALEADYIQSLLPKPSSKPAATAVTPTLTPAVAAKPKLSEEEMHARERWRRLVEMVRKGKVDAVGSFWDKYAGELNLAGGAELPKWLWEEEGKGKESTLLMVAVVAGQEEMTRWLMEEKKVDPTVAVPSSSAGVGGSISGGGSAAESGQTSPTKQASKADPTTIDTAADGLSELFFKKPTPFRTAYDLATTKPLRNIFRRLAHDHPDWYDWTSTSPGGARVPSGLSAEAEEEQSSKKVERRKGLKEKMKEREAKKAAEEKEMLENEPAVVVPVRKEQVKAVKGPQRLGGGGPTGGETERGGLNGLSPEVRQRIERERRARAAEARMAKS